MSPEERRSEQHRTLIDAAAHVFARDGFGNASVAGILDASGLSRGTFYRHFRDLREAFIAVQEDAAEVLFTQVEAATRDNADPREMMRGAVGAYYRMCADHGDLSRVFHREALGSGKEYGELRRRMLDRMGDLFRAGLRVALDRGLIQTMPDDLIIYGVVVAIEGIALRYLEDHRESELPNVLDSVLHLGFRALS